MLMAAVAVAAVACALLGRSARFWLAAASHRRLALVGAARVNALIDGRPVAADIPTDKGWWHKKLEYKYEHAARHPWLPVEPDPTEPK
jgi:hypothetical protein